MLMRTSPDFSPGRWLLSETYLLSISYGNILNIPSLQTALDAPSLVFVPPADTCSLNRSYGYAFGPRIKYGAGSGARWRHKSGAFIASPGEKSGLAEQSGYISLNYLLVQSVLMALQSFFSIPSNTDNEW